MRPGSVLPLAVLCVLTQPVGAQQILDPIDTESGRQPINTVVPRYPEAARRERIEGEVQLCFDINRSGYPRRVSIRRSTHRYFNKAARDAVRRSTWAPIPAGEKVPGIKACRTFRFSLVPVAKDEPDAAAVAPRTGATDRN